MNQEVELQYCFEHSGRTCCSEDDIMPLRIAMSVVKHKSSPKVSDKCFALTSRMLCSKCDADISTGVNPNGAICLNFCDEWFLSCMEDFIDPYIDPE